MRFQIAIALIGTMMVSMVQGFVPCSNPAKHVGHYVGRNQECAALVQTSCHHAGGGTIGLTGSWKR